MSENTSTINSYVNSATGALQSGLASVTGNTSEKVDAQDTKAKGHAQKQASESAAKVGPYAVGSEGGVAQDDPNRTQGQYDQTMGSVKEATGNLIGNESLRKTGRDQNSAGQGQEAKGQVKDLGHGFGQRVQGAVGGAVAGVTSDRADQDRFANMHDDGKARQRGVEVELNKQAEAERAGRK